MQVLVTQPWAQRAAGLAAGHVLLRSIHCQGVLHLLWLHTDSKMTASHPCRHLNFGGYARAPFRDCQMCGLDGGAGAVGGPAGMYDPGSHLRTNPGLLLGNALLWAAALALKFPIDYFILVSAPADMISD